ncbi:hypothetical protein LACPH_002298 [Lacticaseibacillus parahuelsenbergensis]|uniref:Transcriptional regulator n=1 Tax=Lacticaseibacillus parahuelsenbergensis TaxID=3068305 RepID=A0ABY9L1L8_9LACO|nr:hypothetical protein [Lacticaseibacillus sp. NCIMB 15471]WLV77543.1 hypothetical protein LACPH_002298 [Lacticaseibacillus sp. NCIMB 15471]
MDEAINEEHECFVKRLAAEALVSDGVQLPLREIIAILPLPADFLSGKMLALTATANYLLPNTSLSFVRYHEDESIYSQSVHQVIVTKLYHGNAEKLPKMLAGPGYAFIPLSAPDHRSVIWVASHHLVDHAIQRRGGKQIITVKFCGNMKMTLPTTYHAAHFSEILAGSRLLMDVTEQLARISAGHAPLADDPQHEHTVLVDHQTAKILMHHVNGRLWQQGAKQAVGEDRYMLQSVKEKGRNPDGV